jgi:N-acetylneuraminate synthase
MDDCALGEEEEFLLKKYVEDKGAIFLSTPFSRAAFHRLKEFNVQAFKIGSGECNNYPLLDLVAKDGKPIILSTGMNSFDSIDKAVGIFKKNKIPYALLHTTNLYPTPHNLVRLDSVTQLQQRYKVPIGLSDHTIDNNACIGAVALGASILERHFTDSMLREGPDIVCSMDPEAAKELVQASKIVYQCRGGNKAPIPEEQVTMDFAFASVCTTKEIKLGEVLSEDNIWVKRPGKGDFSAEDFYSLLGRKVNQDIPNDIQLRKEHIE